ncbi:MAG: FAD-binding protein [Phycisphaerae bacterium]|nr:FAD-binding protein [Phycisphaerae bacterium]
MTSGSSPKTHSLPVLTSLGAREPVSAEISRERMARDLGKLGLRDVRFGAADRMLYATEASIYQVEPIGVVVLDTPADAEKVVRYCAEAKLPVLPRGGGTSLNGQTVNAAVVLDFSAHCRRILSIDADTRRARVEPGVVLDQLNDALKPHGLMFPPDPNTGSHNNIGGMIGNNSAGARSILYGRTVEHLVSLDVILADGQKLRLEEGACERDPVQREIARRMAEIALPLKDEIRRRFPKIIRHVDGYNLDLFLDQLERSTPGTFDKVNLATYVCGSEGTLATIVEAELNLVEAPKRTGLAIVGFDSVAAALDALAAILATKPAAVELVDDTIVDLARKNTEYAQYVSLMPQPTSGKPLGAVLYVEYFGFGDTEAATRSEIERKFAELGSTLPNAPTQCHLDPAAMRKAWTLRRACEPLLHGIPGMRKPIGFVEDTAVDPSRLPGFIREFKEILAKHGTFAAFFAHASVGCLHIRPLLSLKVAEDRERMKEISVEIADLVVRHGGALSGEHGMGRSRTHLMERYFGAPLVEAMRQIAAAWDPEGRMNPGTKLRWTDPDTMVERLRVKPADHVVSFDGIDTHFTYEREHGFGHAVEMCNGAGLCRRMSAGTMCPSYQATKDERHSTRGRGNHLRLAISGQLAEAGEPGSERWKDPEVYETLRLCLSCKACKAECPSNVDIAKLKAEYLAQRYDVEGVPLQARAFAAVRLLNRLGSMVHPLANAMNGFAPYRWLQEKLLGIDRRRSMPPFGPSALAWHARRDAKATARGERPTVLLFADCFSTYSEPQVARAAIETLEAFGYRVAMPDVGCCGRARISMGDLRRARVTCATTARNLLAAMEREKAVALLGLEPSCLSAIVDDWQELKMDVDRAALARLAANAFLVEAFLDGRWNEHPTRPSFRAPAEPIVLHGHCHQKALWGVGSSSALLERIAPGKVTTLNTGCCGMAGSFGFTTDRYDLSMAIGELALLPAVRHAPESTTVCAPGTSCRHQILDGATRHAKHPMEVVRELLA